MYEELIKRLRKAQAISEDIANDRGRPPRTEYREAADAIEYLLNKLVITECERGIYAAAATTIIRKPQWISVKERMPEIGEKVLVWYEWLGESQKHSIAFDRTGITSPGAERPHWRGHRGERISHWMPLPKPPEEKKEET